MCGRGSFSLFSLNVPVFSSSTTTEDETFSTQQQPPHFVDSEDLRVRKEKTMTSVSDYVTVRNVKSRRRSVLRTLCVHCRRVVPFTFWGTHTEKSSKKKKTRKYLPRWWRHYDSSWCHRWKPFLCKHKWQVFYLGYRFSYFGISFLGIICILITLFVIWWNGANIHILPPVPAELQPSK